MKFSRKRKSYKKRSHKKSRKSYKKKTRLFGYSHNMSPEVYNVSQQKGGILLANDAFSWMGNPTARTLMSGSG
jgi:hypothetical protein